MKYLKKYNESKMQTFIEWLDEIERDGVSENIYEFEFRVKKIYNISEDVDINKFPQYLLNEKGIDICELIASEIELDFLNVGKAFKEEIEANFDKYFPIWIEQKFDSDVSKFYRLYDLDFEVNKISEDEFNSLKESFNSSNIQNEYPYKEYNQDFKILSLKLIQLKEDNIIVGNFESDRILNEDELESIKDFLSNQFSDEWGKSILQPIEEEIHGLKFETYLIVWWGEGFPSWEIEINEKF